MDVNKVRLELIEEIKTLETVNASQIDAFFARIQVQAVSPGFIMLTSDNAFIKEWIETHYIAEIKKSLKNLYGLDFEVIIEIDNTQKEEDQDINQNPIISPISTTTIPPVEEKVYPNTQIISQIKSREPVVEKSDSVNQSNQETPGDSLLTFENFVIGESNRMAYHMALEVAENPGTTSLNPLFIWGRSGVGKTHLLCSIKNYINKQYPDFKVYYIDTMELVNKYSDAATEHSVNKNSYKDFENFFEQFDVLLIDDVQSLQGKRETVNALFRIINNNIRKGKQLVFSADRAPKNIDLDERYTSRFSSGAVTDIQPPDDETKRNIIRSFIKQYESDEDFKIEVNDNVLDYIVELSGPNVRELKSAILNVIYNMKVSGDRELNRSKLSQLLGNYFISGGKKKITIDVIQRAVEQYYQVSHSDLIGPKRARKIVFPRQVAIYLCYQLADTTGSAIAKQFNRDHATAMHAQKVIEEKLKDDRELFEEIEVIKDLIKEQEN